MKLVEYKAHFFKKGEEKNPQKAIKTYTHTDTEI